MSNYQPNFDHDFQKGLVGENLVNTFLKALEGGTIETKTDSRAWETGNVYIETWHYRGSEENKKQSGINKTTADFWAIASPNGKGFIVIRTEDLKEVIKETQAPESRQPVWDDTTMASIGRLVKVSDIVKKIGLGKV